MRKIIQAQLKILAKMVIKRYKPKVVGITGSVGKTSTKEAIYRALKTNFNVVQSSKNFNNEIGVPLTIVLAKKSPGKSILGWLWIYLKTIKLIIFKSRKYPEILILEMGIDRPGDMEYLTNIVRPDVAVVTGVSGSHMEYFGSIKNIREDKQVLVKKLNTGGVAILNFDNEEAVAMKEVSKERIMSYGINNPADVRAKEIVLNFIEDLDKPGIAFKVEHEGSLVPVMLNYVINSSTVYSVLAGIAVALHFDLNLVGISKSFQNLMLPPGRMNLIKGIKGTYIIDDTYNSSPDSTVSVLEVVEQINMKGRAKKFAVLGSMMELGAESEESHRKIGKKVASDKFDKLFLVGERSRDIGRGAIEAGFDEDDIYYFNKSEQAGRFIQERIKKGDLIIIKGSQYVRMEKIVKELMAEPLKAEKLLVRQGSQWN